MQRRPPDFLLPDPEKVRIRNRSLSHRRALLRLKTQPLYHLHPEKTLRRGVNLIGQFPQHGLGVPQWWIGVGTALGYARERDFIQWDTDIDVRILLDYRDAKAARVYSEKVASLFEKGGFELARVFYWEHRPTQVAFFDRENHDVLFDIYFFYEGYKDGFVAHWIDESHRLKPRHLIDHCESVPWPTAPDVFVNIPSPIEHYLTWRFGEDWRIPVHRSAMDQVHQPCLQPLPTMTALTYGTFDLLHVGHVRLLQQMREYADHVVVGVASDQICRINGKQVVIPEEQRAEMVRAIRGVDEVFIQRDKGQKRDDIERFQANYVMVGDDWRGDAAYQALDGHHGAKLTFLPRTDGVSTSQIKATFGGERSLEDARGGTR